MLKQHFTDRPTETRSTRPGRERVTMVSTPGDGSCGIGTYARDLVDGIDAIEAETVHIPQEDRSLGSIVGLALRAGRADGDVIHVQHEYGLFRREGSKYPGLMGVVFFPLLYLFARLGGRDVVVTMHSVLDLSPDEAPFSVRLFMLLQHKLLAACASHLVFLAPDCASTFRQHIHLDEGEFTLLSHGVNTDVGPDVSQAEAKRQFGYDPDETVVAIPGFVRPPKGHDIFVAVAEALPEYEFLIAGGARPKGADFDYAKSVAADAPENVSITGVLDDDEYWRALTVPDLALLPYRVVTQSGTFNACATRELPVLASDAEYFTRIEDEWGAPATVDITDVDAVVERVRALVEEPARRRQLARVMTQYKRANSFEQVGAQHVRIYRRLRTGARPADRPSETDPETPVIDASAPCAPERALTD